MFLSRSVIDLSACQGPRPTDWLPYTDELHVCWTNNCVGPTTTTLTDSRPVSIVSIYLHASALPSAHGPVVSQLNRGQAAVTCTTS